MVTLSMEPRKWIITIYNNYSLTSYSISCRLTPEMFQLLTNWMLYMLLPSSNDRNYSEHATYMLITNNNRQHRDLILCCCGCIKYVCCPWFEWFICLYFAYCAWAGFGGGKAWEVKLYMCYCSSANVIHVYIAHMLLTSISQNFLRDSHVSVKYKMSCTVAGTSVYCSIKVVEKIWTNSLVLYVSVSIT